MGEIHPLNEWRSEVAATVSRNPEILLKVTLCSVDLFERVERFVVARIRRLALPKNAVICTMTTPKK
jgi:hypothetical protein